MAKLVIQRTYILGAVLILAGGAMAAMSSGRSELQRTEQFMEDKAPETVAGNTYIRSNENAKQSYKMDELTYKTLTPYGIVCRKFQVGAGTIDAVLIASRQKGSFHDPHTCFSAQGSSIEGEEVVMVNTKSRGTIPVRTSIFSSETGPKQWVAYFYKGPFGFKDSPTMLKFDIYKYELFNGASPESVFYRFIADKSIYSKEELMSFVASFVDEANTSSEGFF